jgi:hypothetical protein
MPKDPNRKGPKKARRDEKPTRRRKTHRELDELDDYDFDEPDDEDDNEPDDDEPDVDDDEPDVDDDDPDVDDDEVETPVPARSAQRDWRNHDTDGIDTKPLGHEAPSTRLSEAHGNCDALNAVAELSAVIEAWPTLPAMIRAGILAMVRAASKGEGDT